MNHATLEQVIEAAGQLPPEDQRRLQEWLQAQEREAAANHQRQEALQEEMEKFREAMKWIEEHRTQYLDQWVALEGDQLISHGTDARQVHARAKAAGIKAPFVVRVLEKQEPFYAGW